MKASPFAIALLLSQIGIIIAGSSDLSIGISDDNSNSNLNDVNVEMTGGLVEAPSGQVTAAPPAVTTTPAAATTTTTAVLLKATLCYDLQTGTSCKPNCSDLTIETFSASSLAEAMSVCESFFANNVSCWSPDGNVTEAAFIVPGSTRTFSQDVRITVTVVGVKSAVLILRGATIPEHYGNDTTTAYVLDTWLPAATYSTILEPFSAISVNQFFQVCSIYRQNGALPLCQEKLVISYPDYNSKGSCKIDVLPGKSQVAFNATITTYTDCSVLVATSYFPYYSLPRLFTDGHVGSPSRDPAPFVVYRVTAGDVIYISGTVNDGTDIALTILQT